MILPEYHLNKEEKVECFWRASPAKNTPHPGFLRRHLLFNMEMRMQDTQAVDQSAHPPFPVY